MISFIWNFCNGQIYKEEKQNISYQDVGCGEMENYCLIGTECLFGLMKKYQKQWLHILNLMPLNCMLKIVKMANLEYIHITNKTLKDTLRKTQ